MAAKMMKQKKARSVFFEADKILLIVFLSRLIIFSEKSLNFRPDSLTFVCISGAALLFPSNSSTSCSY